MMTDGHDQGGSPQKSNVSRVVSSPSVRISTIDLLRGAKELIILHEGMEYRLRVTSQNKLILTK